MFRTHNNDVELVGHSNELANVRTHRTYYFIKIAKKYDKYYTNEEFSQKVKKSLSQIMRKYDIQM